VIESTVKPGPSYEKRVQVPSLCLSGAAAWERTRRDDDLGASARW
jgi:hypothetical protein